MKSRGRLIGLFTDFGASGPYIGQVKTVLAGAAPGVPVIDLMADAPAFDAEAAGLLLSRLVDPFPPGSVLLCVVDPGVGSARLPLIVQAGGYWFVGPDNGLFESLARRFGDARAWVITWRPAWPAALSASFHGRDLFAPVAARIASGTAPEVLARPLDPAAWRRADHPNEPARVIYMDAYGNAMTGLWAESLMTNDADGRRPRLTITGVAAESQPVWATTFSDVEAGQALFYANSLGLVEIAVNCGSAREKFGLFIGSRVNLQYE
ncbi:MAG: SAM hydrolase/SAM-dependent halogenase family protein [Rhodospirillales bacterium]